MYALLKSLVKLARGKAEIVRGPLTYNQDALATRNNCDFLNDPEFNRAYDAGKRTDSWKNHDIHWRSHVICWAARIGAALDGDFVECGVNRGGSAMVAMTFVNFDKLPKQFYLLDTFDGIDLRHVAPEERKYLHKKWAQYDECHDDVVETFKSYSNVCIIRGSIPDTLSQVTTEHIAYLSLDMNCAAPEIAAAEYFWPKMLRGAVIVLDDYGWRQHEHQKAAFDKFAVQHKVGILSLPTGQGIIIKP